MKNCFQRTADRIFGLKSKTFMLSFCPNSSPTARLLDSCLCSTATRDRAARDARHGAGCPLAVHHDDQLELRQILYRAPEEHARFRINRLVFTILMRHGAELIRRYLEPENAPQQILRVHRPGTVHRQQAGGPVQHLLHHCRDYLYGEFARRFDGKKLNATVTEHATKQIKEFDRRFDGKKYIINEDNCAEHRNKKRYGKLPELDKGE